MVTRRGAGADDRASRHSRFRSSWTLRIFLPLFEQRNLPEGWLAGLIDRNGNFVARSREHERTVGKPASDGFRDAARDAREGWKEMISLEGGTIANGHVTSPLSGWVMGLAADKALFEAPIRSTILIAGLAGGVATLLSMLLAIWAARQIARPIEQIEQGTHALVQRQPIAFPHTGVPEVDRALDAFTSTAQAFERNEKERDEREAHVRLIMRELSHRSKNLLAIVLAIARQTARHTTTFRDFEARFNSRIQALADAHDLLVEQQWGGALLDDLVSAQLVRLRHGEGHLPRRAGHAARRGGAERRAGAARACDQRLEIRRAVGARRPGRDRLGVSG